MLRIQPEVIVVDVVVTMAGDMDAASIKGFSDWLTELTGEGPTVVTVEASEIESPEDDGPMALVELAKQLQDRGGELRLLNTSLQLRRHLIHTDPAHIVRLVDQ